MVAAGIIKRREKTIESTISIHPLAARAVHSTNKASPILAIGQNIPHALALSLRFASAASFHTETYTRSTLLEAVSVDLKSIRSSMKVNEEY
jgi:hypothetical protein